MFRFWIELGGYNMKGCNMKGEFPCFGRTPFFYFLIFQLGLCYKLDIAFIFAFSIHIKGLYQVYNYKQTNSWTNAMSESYTVSLYMYLYLSTSSSTYLLNSTYWTSIFSRKRVLWFHHCQYFSISVCQYVSR